jgi:hypothetical protein
VLGEQLRAEVTGVGTNGVRGMALFEEERSGAGQLSAEARVRSIWLDESRKQWL